MDAPDTKSLPENAYEPLRPGEVYAPIVPATTRFPEVTSVSLFWGLLFCVIFTVASAYSGLKVGQVMEAAIPISILAIGLTRVVSKDPPLLQNVIVTGIGGVSASVVAGAIFTLPALYSLSLSPHPLQTIFICLAGGCLGVLFLIPLRRYFVREMHGQYPYPEATAITEVLVTGEKGGTQAKLLIQATVIAGIYDFFVTTFHVWKEFVDFQFIPLVKEAADKARVVCRFDAIAFILGLGYVMGLRSSMILCAGGVLSNLVLVPLIYYLGAHFPDVVPPGTKAISAMSANEIFRGYVRFIGVGAIATAGIFGILKSLRVVAGSFGIAIKAFRHGEGHVELERTDRDISIMTMLLGTVVTSILAWIFFGTLGAGGWSAVVAGLLLMLVFSFFFTSVAANAIATTARNPVSGMTMLTIMISSVVLLNFGLSGPTGMFFVMAIAGMVCTALSVSGQTITDLKTGYWLGSTPQAQERVKFLGVIAASVAAALTIAMLSRTYFFGEGPDGIAAERILAAPQASIMKALVQSFMNREPVAWALFGVGSMIAVVLEMLQVPALTFALGMYLPLELNSPALVGGYLHHLVTRRSAKRGGESGRSLRERGVVIASGMMAGGALGGVFGAALRIVPWSKLHSGWAFSEEWIKLPFYDLDTISQVVSIAGFMGLVAYIWLGANRER
jgi:putative OPT family oligopeptide transporter